MENHLLNHQRTIKEIRTIKELKRWDEQGDKKVIIHTVCPTKNGSKRVVTLSNSGDTSIMLLRYIDGFIQRGLEELWLQYGTGESRCIRPLHVWYTELGVEWCRVLTKVLVVLIKLTGKDFLSTIEMKLVPIKLNSLRYLSGFGETQSILDVDMLLTEKYLVSVWTKVRDTTSAKTFEFANMGLH